MRMVRWMRWHCPQDMGFKIQKCTILYTMKNLWMPYCRISSPQLPSPYILTSLCTLAFHLINAISSAIIYAKAYEGKTNINKHVKMYIVSLYIHDIARVKKKKKLWCCKIYHSSTSKNSLIIHVNATFSVIMVMLKVKSLVNYYSG